MKTLLIFISVKKTGEKLQNFLSVLGKIEEKDKITENSYAMFHRKLICHVSNQSSFNFSVLLVRISKLIILSEQNMWLRI